MTRLDDELTVFRLALLTEDADRGELGALRRVAERLERQWNDLTAMNIAKRVGPKGPLDLFGPWGQQRPAKHAAWWTRLQRNLADSAVIKEVQRCGQ